MQTTTPLPPQKRSRSRDDHQQAAAVWLHYLAVRARGLVVVLVAITILTFLVVRLVPGDPARLILGPTASAEDVKRVREQLGLTDSLPQQFWSYVTGILHGDLGTSFTNSQPVSTLLSQRFPLTVELACAGLLVVILLGFPLGLAAGLLGRDGRGAWRSGVFSAITSVVGALPEYITGTLLILIFPLTLGYLPVQGGSGPDEILLPALAVGLGPAAVLARLVRNETRAVLNQEYMMTAASKRISTWRTVSRHILPNVITSTLTLGGVLLIALIGGTVITENVFNMAGLGNALVRAVQSNDYPVVQGILLLLGLVAVLINVAVDVVLGVLDPRVLGETA
ncbi:peptide/nickel transport system permease protein [Actinokineospora alba]|uniref:Peptide/nickel transport system permease protein n=1 Tax=Actinokineospora alba TaxID=504798 RepID=A0A1H0L6F1_9PSEU|nr:ABC transporter permease [Actinokineospora alba]TDP67212.1 peptide/nickel transport system permease protein [Actinokineospora alba]SDJ04286.1 peptide/nickel transport system permease protein [Actinokineospora alba]SDO63540.1 peptide/nickel transport system permease protein [Actinokineospora alba]